MKINVINVNLGDFKSCPFTGKKPLVDFFSEGSSLPNGDRDMFCRLRILEQNLKINLVVSISNADGKLSDAQCEQLALEKARLMWNKRSY